VAAASCALPAGEEAASAAGEATGVTAGGGAADGTGACARARIETKAAARRRMRRLFIGAKAKGYCRLSF